jgi:hypothetical protein
MATQSVIGWRKYVDLGLDTDSTLFINASGITDTTQKSAVNTLVKDLKRFGLWSKIKAFYPFVGGTPASHKWNLKDPRDLNEAYRLTFNGGWTHDLMGVKCNGSNTTAETYLSLRTVFGATSYEHNLGIYITDNPTARISYRSDIWASDGSATSTPNISQVTANNTTHIVDMTTNWWSWIFTPTDVRGHTEFKRYRQGYVTSFVNGVERADWRNTTNSPYYNPVATVKIGSSESMNRYTCAYITSAITTLESYLMYIAVQRYQTTLSRQYGTGISATTAAITYSGTAPSLVTNGLKVNLDSSNVTEPQDVIMRLPGANQPGPYFLKDDVWPDSSGNANNGLFKRSDSDNRSSKYYRDDLFIPEIRFHDATVNKIYGTSADWLDTPYSGTDSSNFTFGGWFKLDSTYNGFYFARGMDGYGGGWSMTINGGPGGKVGFSVVPTSGTIVGAVHGAQINISGTTTLQTNVWYNAYVVWKPNNFVKIYLNGVLEVSYTITIPSVRSSTAGWGINRVHSGNWFGKSIIGAFHVYERDLSDVEILQNFNAQRRKYNV